MIIDKLVPGSTIARTYEVVRPLSDGGMGSVYVVRHREIGDLRALKLMHPNVARDESLRQKFKQEARVGALLKTDHVVRVMDVGVDEATGQPWLAMELLEGQDLRTFILEKGPHPLHTLRQVFFEIGHALTAAHRAGVVHRDLKPENIFVARTSRADGAFTIKILDFGIAKILAETENGMSMAIGSPLWMAPEQAALGEEVSARTDVWAFGLIVFFCLTGRNYWRAGNVAGANAPMALAEVLYNPMVPASTRAAELGVSPSTLPPGFDAWFSACVNRTFTSRFADGAVALAALERVMSGSAQPSQPFGPSQASRQDFAKLPSGAPPTMNLHSQPAPTQVGPHTYSAHTPVALPSSNTTGVVSSQAMPARSRGGSRAALALLGGAALLGGGLFLFRNSLFGGAESRKAASSSSPVAALPPSETASSGRPASGGADFVEPAVSVRPTAEPQASSALPPAASVQPAPTPTPVLPPQPTVKPPATTPTPRPTVDCTDKYYRLPDGTRKRKPECPA